MEFTEERIANRWSVVGETIEQNVRFSISLSVGRLRKRVLRRSSFLDSAFGPSEQGREASYPSHVGEGQMLSGGMLPTSVEDHTISSPASFSQGGASMPGSLYGPQSVEHQRFDVDTPRLREASYHDLLEYRSNFLERRRRIRCGPFSIWEPVLRISLDMRGPASCLVNTEEGNAHARLILGKLILVPELVYQELSCWLKLYLRFWMKFTSNL